MPSSINPSRLCIDRMFMNDLIEEAMHTSSKSNICTRRRLIVSLGSMLLGCLAVSSSSLELQCPLGLSVRSISVDLVDVARADPRLGWTAPTAFASSPIRCLPWNVSIVVLSVSPLVLCSGPLTNHKTFRPARRGYAYADSNQNIRE